MNRLVTPGQTIDGVFGGAAGLLKQNRAVKRVELREGQDLNLFVFTSRNVIQVQGFYGLSREPETSMRVSIYRMGKRAFLRARKEGTEGSLATQQILEVASELPLRTTALLRRVGRYLGQDVPLRTG